MSKATPKPSMLFILGPTASGKSDLAIALARKMNGEIISVDSRQVYRGMDIGSGKVTKPEQKLVRHHLIDIVSPKEEYNVSHFLRHAEAAILDIRNRGKFPILCGGTNFWIEALIFGIPLPSVPPDETFREKWGAKDAPELFAYLKRLDPERAKTIDKDNKVRLLRALEIARVLGKVPPLAPGNTRTIANNVTFIGLNPPVEELSEKIKTRLKARFREGMIDEVKRLYLEGVSFERLESFGLEYRAIALFLQNKVAREKMEADLLLDSIHYAKRQRSSLRRLERKGITIEWFPNKEAALENY